VSGDNGARYDGLFWSVLWLVGVDGVAIWGVWSNNVME